MKYEYKVVKDTLPLYGELELNVFGQDRWELVSATINFQGAPEEVTYIFKRQIPLTFAH